MNEEQQKADKELFKELSGRFVKAYSDHEFKLLLEAQARIIRAEERERAVEIFEHYLNEKCPSQQRIAGKCNCKESADKHKQQILSSNQSNNE